MTGTLDVDAVLCSLTSQQINEWQAYYRLEPFGHEHSDYLAARQLAMTYNVHRQQGAPAADAKDFLPYQAGKSQEWQDMFDRLRQAKRGGA